MERPEVVAVGETGLDRHWDFTPFAVQEDYFARHLALGGAAPQTGGYSLPRGGSRRAAHASRTTLSVMARSVA